MKLRHRSSHNISPSLIATLLFVLQASAAVFLVGGISSDAQSSESNPCIDESMVVGSLEQKSCLAKHISGFGGYEHSICSVKIYLTDLGKIDSARMIVTPVFKKSRAFRFPNCRNISIDFRKAQYKYVDLLRWAKQAWPLLYKALSYDKEMEKTGLMSMSSSPFVNNKIRVRVDSDESARVAREFLAKQGLPVDAFSIISVESREKALAARHSSVVPEIIAHEGTTAVEFPAVDWTGNRLAMLRVGKTSLDEALRLLPAWPGHGPDKGTFKKPSWITQQQSDVLESIDKFYTPQKAHMMLGFNEDDRLVFSRQRISNLYVVASLRSKFEILATLEEVFDDQDNVVVRANLTDCAVTEIVFRKDDEGIAQSAEINYFFVCPTDKEGKRIL